MGKRLGLDGPQFTPSPRKRQLKFSVGLASLNFVFEGQSESEEHSTYKEKFFPAAAVYFVK